MKTKKTTNIFEVFAKKAKYQGGSYLIECNGKVLIADTPKELREKFEKELQKAN